MITGGGEECKRKGKCSVKRDKERRNDEKVN